MLLTPVPLAVDWQQVSDQATVLGVFVALAVGLATTVVMIRQEKVTRKGQQLQSEYATAAAERAESAARLTEEYTRRVVEALETMAARPAGAELVIAAPRVRWSLEHHDGDKYLLTNIGDAAAHSVRISADKSLDLVKPTDGHNVDAGEALGFMAVPTMATRDFTITVEWFDLSTAQKRTWRYPLPTGRRR
ncbi:hypothetical protein [Micromonospora sp. NPDC000668]|uniref:hypothetical protein n=1 Tax=Micromonospora sp. NPDC000668 TaxID=3364219 RepID=UPI0036C01501